MLFGLLLLQTLQGQSVFPKLPKICISLPHFSMAAGTPSFDTTKIVSLLIFSIFVSAFFGDQRTPDAHKMRTGSEIPFLITNFDSFKHFIHISEWFSDAKFNGSTVVGIFDTNHLFQCWWKICMPFFAEIQIWTRIERTCERLKRFLIVA